MPKVSEVFIVHKTFLDLHIKRKKTAEVDEDMF